MKIAHLDASNVVPSFASSSVSENVLEKVVGNALKSNLLENLPTEEESRVKKILKSLNPQEIVID